MGCVLLAALLLTACGPPDTAPTPDASPQTYYVSTTGSDRNAGTIAAPWLTISSAVAKLRAGDTLYIRGGTYTGTVNAIDSAVNTVPSGTSWENAITIAGYPSETVTIRVGDGPGIRLTTSAPHYLIFQDFAVDMTGSSAAEGVYLSSGAHHNRFQRLDISHARIFGVAISTNNGNSPFNEVLDSRIHHNGLEGSAPTEGHGLYVFTSDNLFAGNEIFSNQGYGLHLYENSGPMNVSRNIVRNNRFYDNGLHGGTAYAIVVNWGAANQIYNNTIDGNPGGILIYTNSTNASVYDNTISNNKPLEGVAILGATGSVVKDNIIFGNETNILDQGTGTVLSNNRPS